MQIIIRKISVAAKPPSSAEIEEMEDIGFGTNGSISGDKWIHGLQFALYDGDYPELDELEFKQLAYYGDCDFEFINRKLNLQTLVPIYLTAKTMESIFGAFFVRT